jgi:integrase
VTATKRKQRESFGAVRKLPSGRVQASYVGPDGLRHKAPHTFDGLTDARAWLATQRARIVEGKWQSVDTARLVGGKQRHTLGDYAETWLNTRTSRNGEHLKPRTRAEYERLISTCMAPLTPLRLNAITPSVVREWYSTLSASGAKTQAARAYSLLKSILNTAVEDGRIAINPCKIRGAHTASTGKRVEPPTAQELATIVDRISDRYKAAVLIAAWAGVRYGELTELRRKDLTLVGDSIVVNVSRAVTHVVGHGFIVGTTKSVAGMRSINLPPHIVPRVLEHLDRYVDDSPDALLFPAADGVSHLAQSTLAKSFYPAREAAGRADMPWHALRHYGATRAAQAGATLRELQDRLGHSTVSAAMKYQHTAGRDAELAKRMSELA